MSAGQIGSFDFPLPPVDEQRAIAHILGTLDDRIELNRQMNQTLEAIARALFKSSFVGFDPSARRRRGAIRGRRGVVYDSLESPFRNFSESNDPKLPNEFNLSSEAVAP